MSDPVPQARQQLLDSIEELARQTERVRLLTAGSAAVGLVMPEIRLAFDQVHKALYAIHTRLDALDDRST